MANLISFADGNLTAAGTWETTDSTALVEPATLGSTALTASNQDSAAFQPGAVTVDGVAIRLASRAAGSPSNTMTVTLRKTSAPAGDVASVTVNVSDLAVCTTSDLEGGWYFFKFSASQLLLAATNYVIRISLSATTTAVSIATNNTAANWLHMLRITTTAAPAAGDNMHVMGEFDGASNPATTSTRTVTMNQTANTDYGSANVIANKSSSALSVCNRGTVTYGTTGGVNYLLRLSGNLNVYSGGTFRIGNTGGSEIPRNSSAILEFDITAADGDFGLLLRNGSTFSAYGLSRTSGKNEWMCKLIADSAIADTTLDVDTDTGWLNADEIAIASTSQTATQHERKILNGAAGAALLTITAGLASAKLGSGDYHGEVLLLTRNVEIRSTSTTLVTFVRFAATATCACEWVSFRYISSSTQAFQIETTTGSLTLRYCILQDLDFGIFTSGGAHGNWTIDKSALYNQRGASGSSLLVAVTSGAWTLTDFMAMGQNNSVASITFSDVGGTIGNLWVSSHANSGIAWNEAAIEASNGPTFSGSPTWVIHSGAEGLAITASVRNITFPRTEVWHCARANYVSPGSTGSFLDNVEFNGGFWLGNGPGAGEEPCGFWVNGQAGINDLRFRSLDIAADSTFASNWGVLFDKGRIAAANVQFIDCNFSQTSGTRRQTTIADIGCIADVTGGMAVMGIATNCTFNSAGTPVSFYYAPGPTPTRNSKYSAIRCPKFGGSATAHRTYTPRATFFIETGTVDVTPGLRIDPLEGAAVPADSNCYQPGWGFCVPVLSGATVTVSVKVQKSAGYNGSTEPQLVLLANPQLGLTEAVIDTLSVGSGSWETLTGTTAAAGADGVMEFVVRTYGTAGSVFVDTWDAL